jgi:hypothetical protein
MMPSRIRKIGMLRPNVDVARYEEANAHVFPLGLLIDCFGLCRHYCFSFRLRYDSGATALRIMFRRDTQAYPYGRNDDPNCADRAQDCIHRFSSFLYLRETGGGSRFHS